MKEFKITLEAARPVAVTSADHQNPLGTKQDMSRNLRFNQKMYSLFPRSQTLRVLDLGCSGGTFVRDCLDDGCLAVGLEGSDYSKIMKRAEWSNIPGYLFTCDISAPFQLRILQEGREEDLKFDIITTWEVLEHIAAADLPMLADNVKRHLKPGGLWIVSVCSTDDFVDGVNLHKTLQSKSWWLDTFRKLGLENQDVFLRYFNTQFVRGPKYRAPDSFNLVLARPGEALPNIPKESLQVRLFDRWLNCRVQRFLRTWLVGGDPTWHGV
jgi:SAM-dependent methyltransferase